MCSGSARVDAQLPGSVIHALANKIPGKAAADGATYRCRNGCG